MRKRIWFNFILAMEGIADNRLRAFLTALGIVFGVAAVIAMLAIGNGAKAQILAQMKLIGTNNIEIIPKSDGAETADKPTFNAATNAQQTTSTTNKQPYSTGLTLKDAEAIQVEIPTVRAVSPEVIFQVNVVRNSLLKKANCIGITNAFFELNNLNAASGSFFHPLHANNGAAVCVIGSQIKSKFFSNQNPLGKKIKCGTTWLTVIGVLEQRLVNQEKLEKLGIRDYNSDIYIPIQTALLRFNNRAAIHQNRFETATSANQTEPTGSNNYHQLDRLVVRVEESKYLIPTSEVVGRMLKRRHLEVVDYQINVPELLLEQEQKTQNTFNIVLAVIAGISLLVGGIGIMNIMLATVLERIKEIGIRRSLGATRFDIVAQFLFEAVAMSLLGGVLGIFLGLFAAGLIASFAKIPTIVSSWSVIMSFAVAASVGLVFGLAPARRAAFLDPIVALRND